MKIRHFALLILILATIVLMQPLVLLVGNLALLGGVLAFIYSDLPPASQEAWDNRISSFLKQVRLSLKNRSKRIKKAGPPDVAGPDTEQSQAKLRNQPSIRLEEEFGQSEIATARSSKKDDL